MTVILYTLLSLSFCPYTLPFLVGVLLLCCLVTGGVAFTTERVCLPRLAGVWTRDIENRKERSEGQEDRDEWVGKEDRGLERQSRRGGEGKE